MNEQGRKPVIDASFEQQELFPIREVSRLTGVNAVTLRAWERRYGLIQPIRTDSGHRLYSQADIDEIRRILGWLERGVAVSKVGSILARGHALSGQAGGAVDVGRRFGEDNKFGLRFNGVKQAGDTEWDHQRVDREMAVLGLDFRGERVRLSADVGHTERDTDAPQERVQVAAAAPVPSDAVSGPSSNRCSRAGQSAQPIAADSALSGMAIALWWRIIAIASPALSA